MDKEFIESNKIYSESKLRYKKIKNDVYNLFKKYENKDRISIIFEFWLWQINIILSIYGEKGFLDFLKSEIYDPYSFASFLDNRAYDKKLVKIKNNKFKFIFFKNSLNNNLYFSSYSAKNLLENLKCRFTAKFIKYLPIQKDYKLRKKILELVISYFSDIKVINLESYLKKKLPLLFYSKPINNFEKTIKIKCAATSFLEFNNYENIFLINSKIYITGYQHGGSYGTFVHNYFQEYEKSLCNKFLGWGLSELNIKQTRYKKINKNSSSLKRIVWIESSAVNKFNLMIHPYCYLNACNEDNFKYIYKEIKGFNTQYFNLIHPLFPHKRYERYRDKSSFGRRKNIENIFFKNDIGIFDNCSSSLIYLFIENQMPFLQVISRYDYERFTIKQKNWFKVLFDNDLAFYNDEDGKLTLSLKKITNNSYMLPKEVISFHKKNFMC